MRIRESLIKRGARIIRGGGYQPHREEEEGKLTPIGVGGEEDFAVDAIMGGKMGGPMTGRVVVHSAGVVGEEEVGEI